MQEFLLVRSGMIKGPKSQSPVRSNKPLERWELLSPTQVDRQIQPAAYRSTNVKASQETKR